MVIDRESSYRFCRSMCFALADFLGFTSFAKFVYLLEYSHVEGVQGRRS